jgi:hypothetical protein
MKMHSIFSLMASLAILGIGGFIKQSAMAEPAPIFRPMLRDIQTQLPRGMVMRLPASLPYRSLPASYNNTLYPYLSSRGGELSIALYYRSKCRANACFAGIFSVSNVDPDRPILEILGKSASCANAAFVNIKPGIKGVYTNNRCGGSGEGTQTILWEQNGLIFEATLRAAANIKKELLEVATSMADEPPIQSVR